MYKASIIIPYFRKKKFFKETVDSILNQTYKNFEAIIIYDDENLDELNYIKTIIKYDKRFKVFTNKKNLGAGLSRNKGISFAKGKYVCFIDADDIWEKNKLKIQINYMEKKKISRSHTSYTVVNSSGEKKAFREAKDYSNYLELRKSCNIGLSTVIIKKNLLKKKFRFPKIKTKEDFVLWLKLVKNGTTIFGLKKNLVKWIKTNNSLSSSLFQKIKDGYTVYHHYLDYNSIKSFYLLLVLSFNFFKKSLLK